MKLSTGLKLRAWTVGALLLHPLDASAVLLQHLNLASHEFQGFARATQQPTWVDRRLEIHERQSEESTSLIEAQVAAQREWIEASQNKVKPTADLSIFPAHEQLWRITRSLPTQSRARQSAARLIERLAKAAAIRVGPIWKTRSVVLAGKPVLDSVLADQQRVDIVRSWLKTWDAVIVNGSIYRRDREDQLWQSLQFEDEFDIVFLSNRFQTVSISLQPRAFAKYQPPVIPWASISCENGQTVALSKATREGDPVMALLYDRGEVKLAGNGLCLMTLKTVERPTGADGLPENLDRFGLKREEQGISLVDAKPPSTLSSRAVWVGVAIALIAGGTYAILQNQPSDQAAPTVHHHGF